MTIISCAFLFISCVPEEESEPQIQYSSLRIEPDIDSVYLQANGETRQFSIVGSIVSVSERTITNSGVITDAQFTVRQIDTTFQSVDASSVQWSSSNSSVATVLNGLVTARSAGYATISASAGSATSQSIVVNVRAVDTAPGLSLDPPYCVIQFENFTSVSGIVQQQSILTVRGTNASYGSDGKFNIAVTGLSAGSNEIAVRATHPANAALYTERVKTVAYYQPGTPQANAIVGDWLGTTLGQNFDFKITYSAIFTRYDIEGKIDIQFDGIGWVRDIDLIGLVNSNGTFDVSLSKTFSGGSVSGKFNGSFQSTGSGSGEYSAQVVQSGWPKISFNEKWTAVKK